MLKNWVFLAISVVVSGVLICGPACAADETKSGADVSCVEPAKGPLVSQKSGEEADAKASPGGVLPARVHVGKPAIDFETNAYHDGKFKNIKLSDYKGKWVVLCFYPGDFTFV